ncbi:MAG: VCBS repeat-containing protein, partial [Proteobacteria bacterium]
VEVYGSLQKKVWEYKFSYSDIPKAGLSLLESAQICYPSGQCSISTKYEYEGLDSSVTESPNSLLPGLGSQEIGLESSSRFATDLNRDGFTDFVALGKKQLEVSWGKLAGLSPDLESIPFSLPTGWKGKDHPVFIGELNGDGYPDLILSINKGDTEATGLWVALGNGRGFHDGKFATPKFGKNWNFSEDYISLHDVNLDGLSDVVGVDVNGVHVALSDGKGSFHVGSWKKVEPEENAIWIGKKRPKMFVDVTGDNYPDLITFHDDGVYVSRGDGQSFSRFEKWSEEFAGSASVADYADSQRQLADVNGDGLSDLVLFDFEGVRVALNNGKTFTPSVLWLNGLTGKTGWSERRALRTTLDWNKDGYLDFVGLDSSKGLVIYFGNGLAFPSDPSASASNHAVPGFSSWQKDRRPLYIGDFDNNGSLDFAALFANGLRLVYAKEQQPRLSRTVDTLGKISRVRYMSAANPEVYSQQADVSYPLRALVGTSLLVHELSEEFLDSRKKILKYHYRDGLIHQAGLGFLGFREWDVTDLSV